MNPYKIDFNSMPWESHAQGVRVKAITRNGQRLRLFEFSSGFVEDDWCISGHIGYVLEGQLKIDFSGFSVVYNPGDAVFIPEGAEHKHKARNVSDFVTLFLVEKHNEDR